MSTFSKFTVTAILSTAMLVGCEKESAKPTPPGTGTGGSPSTMPTTKPATTMPAAVTDAVKTGANVTKTATDAIKSAVGDAPKIDKPKMDIPKTDLPKVDVTPTDVPKVDATKAATDVTAKGSQGKLDDVMQMIKDKKYDAADSALKKLEESKASLPEAMQAKLGDLRKSLDAAKALGEVPSLPAGLNK